MVADDYFDLRSRLGAALFSLGRIADLAGLKPSRAPVVKTLVESLRDPFVFVVAGEVNSGKSTLLNALFGEEFCATGVLPETRRIHYFRYGRTPRRVEAGPLLEEIELPHSFLRDFHVVDTPGVNTIAEGHELITGDYLPHADAVLYCFPATNPWSSAAWEFLGRIHFDWLKKIVLVLQQSDLRTSEETAAIAEHMRNIGKQRLGVELPVFPVSARPALLGRTSGLDKLRLVAESAFPAFEQYLTKMVAGTAPRVEKLVTACSAGQAMLAEVQAKINARAATLRELAALREHVRQEIHQAAAAANKEAENTASSLRYTWDTITAAHLQAALAERHRFPRLLRGNDPTTETIESRLLPPLLTAVREAGNGYENLLDATLTQLWKQAGSTLHRTLEGRVRRPPEPDWPARGGNFLPNLENAACEAVAGSGLASFWQKRLQRRQLLLRALTLLGLLIAGGGLAAVAITGPLPGTIALWLTLLTVGCVLTGRVVLRQETSETSGLTTPILAAAGDSFSSQLLPLIIAHGTRRVADFLTVTTPLEHAIQDKEQATTPLATEASQLAGTLQTLAHSLHRGTARQTH